MRTHKATCGSYTTLLNNGNRSSSLTLTVYAFDISRNLVEWSQPLKAGNLWLFHILWCLYSAFVKYKCFKMLCLLSLFEVIYISLWTIGHSFNCSGKFGFDLQEFRSQFYSFLKLPENGHEQHRKSYRPLYKTAPQPPTL